MGRTNFESINGKLFFPRSYDGVHDVGNVGNVVHVESQGGLAQLGVRFVLMVQYWVCPVVLSRSAVCGCDVERATGKASVRYSGCIQHKSVQARGGAVSEATAMTESVVVEALRMSNSLCEAMGEPPRRTGSKTK